MQTLSKLPYSNGAKTQPIGFDVMSFYCPISLTQSYTFPAVKLPISIAL